jgi:hypothetical protein
MNNNTNNNTNNNASIVVPLEEEENTIIEEEEKEEQENPITLGNIDTTEPEPEMEEVYNSSIDPPHHNVEEENPLYENPDAFGLEEVDITLDNLEDLEKVEIKQRNDVYYQLYKDARKKAKMAHEIAISAYLEAKNIKNTHLLMDNMSVDSEDEEDDDTLEQKIYDLEKTIKRK